MLAAARRSALIVAVVGLAACDDGPVEPGFGLLLAQARWQRANLESYEITVQRLCFCGNIDPVRVTVANGVIVSRVNVVTGQPVADNVAELFPDVPGLFAIVEQARENAAELDVEFDETYGFPTVISIDWDGNAVDDEVVYDVGGFEMDEG